MLDLPEGSLCLMNASMEIDVSDDLVGLYDLAFPEPARSNHF